MSKIYSRTRIKLPLLKFNRNKIPSNNMKKYKYINKAKFAKVLLIFIIAFSTVKIILNAVLPIFNSSCEAKAKSIATVISNEQATAVMKEHSYDELFKIEKDNNGNIIMINANVIAINEIISDVANRIQKEIDEREKEKIEIAIGSFTGLKLLAGRGPNVKITISSVGNVETDLKSEFIEQGVNQTLHRIYLQVNCQMKILTPFEDISKEITNQVLLAENVIMGNIPNNYYNLEGIDVKSDSLELLN